MAEGPELVGRDLAVIHQRGGGAEPAVGRELVELLLGDDAVLRNPGAARGPASRASCRAVALGRDRVLDGGLLGRGDGPVGDEIVQDVRQEAVLRVGVTVVPAEGVGVADGAATVMAASDAGSPVVAATAPAAPMRSRPASGMPTVDVDSFMDTSGGGWLYRGIQRPVPERLL